MLERSSDVNLNSLVRGQDERNHARAFASRKKVNMSSIEQLKAEAIALRAAERTRGNVLKHSDALEQVAKKHGYANWRAAVAMLGDEKQKPDPSPAAPGLTTSPAGIAPSRLQSGEFEIARERAFTRWLSPELRQAAVMFSRRIGLVPIYAETSPHGTRYLFWHLPPGASCEVRSGRTEKAFLEFHRKNQTQGRELVSLHASGNQAYSAVWLSSAHRAPAADCLQRFGIGTAAMR